MMIRPVAIFATACLLSLIANAQPEPLPNSDFTQGGQIPEGADHTWNLGPSGARGWMHSERLETTSARQIYVTEVAGGSPADGILQAGDVILGVSGADFSHDPRVEFAQAITRAEAAGGNLEIRRWRGGQSQNVTVKLPVLGSYSATAPFDCPKSEAILEQGCKVLAARMQHDGYPKTQNAITRSLNALALLASGDGAYLPLVRREVEWASNFSTDSFQVWWHAYVIMLLAEYQLATGDSAFEAGLRRLALECARGQSIVGSWGHTFAGDDGRLIGYGMMNAPGVPLTIALHLARKAGVKEPAIDLAIDRSTKLIRFYAGKGAVPYGDHAPWTQTHEDNGKCGMAAVMFHFLGEAQHAGFFTRMSVASHSSERDTGHTGNFTNMLWAKPSITLAGPNATGAWMKEFGSWYFDFARTWDFRFPNPGPPQKRPCSFWNWDATGGYLLAYAMPKRKIMLTGKQPALNPPLDQAQAAALIADGRGWSNKDRHSNYDAMDEAELLKRLTSWSPIVRERAAIAFSRRRANGMPVAAWIAMLDSPSLHARYGACVALRMAGGDAVAAVPALKSQLAHEDLWLRCQAATALAHLGEPAMSALPVLLERITHGSSNEDPRAMEQRYLIFAVFGRMLKNSVEGVDHEALGKAIIAGLQNQDGRARGELANIYKKLSHEEIRPLLPVIRTAIVEPAPSGIMFADGVRLAGLEILARHRYREGMDLVFDILDIDRWNKRARINRCFEILALYGGAAKPVVPKLRELEEALLNHREACGLQPQIDTLRELIRNIESATTAPELREL